MTDNSIINKNKLCISRTIQIASLCNWIDQVKLEASTDTPGCLLRAPTVEGFKPICTDSFAGNLKLQLWERNANGSLGKVSTYNRLMSVSVPLDVSYTCRPTT